jgi:hypothetical protein
MKGVCFEMMIVTKLSEHATDHYVSKMDWVFKRGDLTRVLHQNSKVPSAPRHRLTIADQAGGDASDSLFARPVRGCHVHVNTSG